MTKSTPTSSTVARLRRTLQTATALGASVVIGVPLFATAAKAIDPPRAAITGRVFDDANRNDVLDPGEKGIPGVRVSDGVAIVTTNEQGGYSISIDPTRRLTDEVFVTQPQGWALPLDEWKTPRFFRNLGQLADGDERAADFAMFRSPESNSDIFTFANVADTHVNPQLGQQIEEINSSSLHLAFIQVSGDLTNKATTGEFNSYRAATKKSSLPVWPAVGNHEYSGGAYAASIENYRVAVGPEWYSFDYGNRHFLVIENNGSAPADEQYEWVKQDLALNVAGTSKRLVVLAHKPMNVPFGGGSAYDRFGDLFEQHHAELMLVGHEHSNDVEPDSVFARGMKHVQTVSSSYTIDNSPRGFRFVNMQSDRFDNPFRMHGVEKSLTITSPAPGESIPRAAFPGIQVNAYDTATPATSVRYRIDGGGWKTLKAAGDFTWFGPWAGPVPAAGQHTVDVRVVDAGGSAWSKSSTFTLTDDAPITPAAGQNWPQHHGDPSHSGVAQDVLEPALRLAWTHRSSATFLTGSPAIVDGVVYAGRRDDNGDGDSTVSAVRLSDGKTLWQYTAPASVVGSLAVADGKVYVPTLRGSLIAVDAARGTELWRRDPVGSGNAFNQRAYSYYSPLVADGKVFWAYQSTYGAASQGLLSALDPTTGQTIWQSPMAGNTMSDGTPAFADGVVFVGSQTADKVIAYDATTGAQLWNAAAVLGGWQDGIPAAAGGRVFIGSGNGIIARDATSGAQLWTYRSSASMVSSNSTPSAPAVHGETVYMGFPSGAVTALDAATGRVIWTRLLPGDIYRGGIHSSPVVSGNTLYVGSNNGNLYGLDLGTGDVLWRFEIGAWVASGPAISGNTLVAGAWDGNLYAFVPNGESVTHPSPPPGVSSTVCVPGLPATPACPAVPSPSI